MGHVFLPAGIAGNFISEHDGAAISDPVNSHIGIGTI